MEPEAASGKGRILQIFNRYLKVGGEAASVSRIERYLEDAGYHVEKCFFDSADWTGAGAPPAWRQATLMLYHPDSVRRLETLQETFGADAWVVHNVFPVGSAATFATAKRLGVPVIHFLHNCKPFMVTSSLPGKPRLSHRWRNFAREVADAAWQGSRIKTAWHAVVLETALQLGWFDSVAAWVGVSEWMREAFVEAGLPAERVFALRHAWDAPPRTERATDDGYYLFLGRLTTAKGVGTLLAAWDLLEREMGERAPRLLIAGEGDLQRLAARTSSRVEWKGLVTGDAKRRLIDSCRAMVAPSVWWEPLGLVTYEAFESSRPMLASRSGGLAETVIDGVTGFLHEPGDAVELARHVTRLEEMTPAARLAMGVRGRAWLEREATRERWMEGFDGIFDRITRGSQLRRAS